ncbi:MAG: NAD(P)H-hydrate dehydratase [Syntrophomonadaceae bacterium]|nr:NAD(P)H-hydrate dehydratase [Syntrophomonadaceae bacterium]
MLLIAGIIPRADLPLLEGRVERKGQFLNVQLHEIPSGQGTAAMISAALALTEYLEIDPPRVILAGDTGRGEGSRKIYEYLVDKVAELSPSVLALHYWMPNLELMHQLYEKLQLLDPAPVLIADAASMYAAKAAGLAAGFDVFTPDLSEIAFLADPEAVHPAYIDKHLFQSCDRSTVPDIINMAYKNNGAARYLLVKGKSDFIADKNGVLAVVDEPDVPELECIGGTGDTITGMCAALIAKGLDIKQALILSARANRLAGMVATATPASRIEEVIARIPEVFQNHLDI